MKSAQIRLSRDVVLDVEAVPAMGLFFTVAALGHYTGPVCQCSVRAYVLTERRRDRGGRDPCVRRDRGSVEELGCDAHCTVGAGWGR